MVRRDDFGEGTSEDIPKNPSEPDSRPPGKSVPGRWGGGRERPPETRGLDRVQASPLRLDEEMEAERLRVSGRVTEQVTKE